MNSVEIYRALRLISIDYRAVSKSETLSNRCVKGALSLCTEFKVPKNDFVSRLEKDGICALNDQGSFITLYRELIQRYRELLDTSGEAFLDLLREMRPAFELDLPEATLRKLYSKTVRQLVDELLW